MSATFNIPQSIREISTNSITILENSDSANAKQPSQTSYTELPAQGFLARMMNLPAVNAINGMISSFPAIKIFTSNLVPILIAKEQRTEARQLEKIAEYQRKLTK
ncbi:hypothetical protein Cantr_04276 [Candida viswanathii]|uniref:Uncharacterized protein n=1 Tax=Candida viswanathii TaxID=5486 RepID=A0A367XN55_9ASCO|nr:hypothetical protein Cantr_04276 [Candida viswanathii]